MRKQIFVNLAVKDLHKSKAFFAALGFSFNPKFTDENAACLIIEDNIFVMLVLEKFITRFTKKEICDAKKMTEVLIAMSVDSRAEVDVMAQKAVAAGGNLYRPADDYGWMYSQSIEDLDGHIWEIMYADESKIPANPAQ